MEKFAERFLSCNPDSFKSADVAYVLAYSVIMLNTDAHNSQARACIGGGGGGGIAGPAGTAPPMHPQHGLLGFTSCPASALQVKNKMSKADFLRNNRGINDGGDLPVEFMESLYDRIVHNEIKMKDEAGLAGGAAADAEAHKAAAGSGWLDTIMNLIPGRAKAASAEPNDEAIRRTHDYLRCVWRGVLCAAVAAGAPARLPACLLVYAAVHTLGYQRDAASRPHG
jgi:brefeldin A-inhibited guanine nucleotide-exchange protein